MRYLGRNCKWHLLKKRNVLKEREAQRLKEEEANGGAQEGDEGEEEGTGKKGKKKGGGEDDEEEAEDKGDDDNAEGGSKSSKFNESIEYAPETYRSGSPLKKSRKANQGYEGG